MLRAVLSSVTAPPPAPAKGEREALTLPAATETAPRALLRERARRLPRAPWRSIDWWRLAPVLAAVAFSIVYLLWEPRTVDLAAHTYRA